MEVGVKELMNRESIFNCSDLNGGRNLMVVVSVTHSSLAPCLYKHKISKRLKGEEEYGAGINQISALYFHFRSPGVGY